MSDSKRRILTAEDVRSIPQGGVLDLPPGALLTDLAREWVADRKILVVEHDAAESSTRNAPARFALGADHGGYETKARLKDYLDEVGASYVDYGTDSEESVDYPDYAHAVALAVAIGHARQGIVIDGAGIGSAIVANKVPGVRAGACYDAASATNAREHNDINVMTLGAGKLAPEDLRELVRIFMTARHVEPRHRRRVAKITDIEHRYQRLL